MSLAAVEAVPVDYCTVCSFPYEYCVYGSSLSKCKTALSKSDPTLFQQLYGSTSGSNDVEAVTESVKDVNLNKEAAKKEAKQEAKDEKAEKKRQSSKVTIKRIERTKRKHVTAIHGLEVFGIDMKKASKFFSNKFATGASVSKNNQGEDEIVIQGDVAYDVEEMLLDDPDKVPEVLGGGKIPEDNIYVVDQSKKK